MASRPTHTTRVSAARPAAAAAAPRTVTRAPTVRVASTTTTKAVSTKPVTAKAVTTKAPTRTAAALAAVAAQKHRVAAKANSKTVSAKSKPVTKAVTAKANKAKKVVKRRLGADPAEFTATLFIIDASRPELQAQIPDRAALIAAYGSIANPGLATPATVAAGANAMPPLTGPATLTDLLVGDQIRFGAIVDYNTTGLGAANLQLTEDILGGLSSVAPRILYGTLPSADLIYSDAGPFPNIGLTPGEANGRVFVIFTQQVDNVEAETISVTLDGVLTSGELAFDGSSNIVELEVAAESITISPVAVDMTFGPVQRFVVTYFLLPTSTEPFDIRVANDPLELGAVGFFNISTSTSAGVTATILNSGDGANEVVFDVDNISIEEGAVNPSLILEFDVAIDGNIMSLSAGDILTLVASKFAESTNVEPAAAEITLIEPVLELTAVNGSLSNQFQTTQIVTLENTGDSPAHGVVLTGQAPALPAGITLQSVTSAAPNVVFGVDSGTGGVTLDLPIGTEPLNNTVEVTFVWNHNGSVPLDTEVIFNYTAVFASAVEGEDVITEFIRNYEVGPVPLPIIIAAAPPVLAKFAESGPAPGTVDFTIVISSTGGDTNPISLQDLLPVGIASISEPTFVVIPDGADIIVTIEPGFTLTTNRGLGENEQIIVNFTGTIAEGYTGPIVNTVTDLLNPGNSASNTPFFAPGIVLTKTARDMNIRLGDLIFYDLNAVSTGSEILTDGLFIETPIPGPGLADWLEFVPELSTPGWVLRPDGTYALDVGAVLPGSTSAVFVVRVIGDIPANMGNLPVLNQASFSATAGDFEVSDVANAVVYINAEADLSIEKSIAANSKVTLGGFITYNIVVRNDGDATFNVGGDPVSISETIPAGLTWNGQNGWTKSGNFLNYDLVGLVLTPGQTSMPFPVTFTIAAGGLTGITNVATLLVQDAVVDSATVYASLTSSTTGLPPGGASCQPRCC